MVTSVEIGSHRSDSAAIASGIGSMPAAFMTLKLSDNLRWIPRFGAENQMRKVASRISVRDCAVKTLPTLALAGDDACRRPSLLRWNIDPSNRGLLLMQSPETGGEPCKRAERRWLLPELKDVKKLSELVNILQPFVLELEHCSINTTDSKVPLLSGRESSTAMNHLSRLMEKGSMSERKIAFSQLRTLAGREFLGPFKSEVPHASVCVQCVSVLVCDTCVSQYALFLVYDVVECHLYIVKFS
jgi:hypothetical protein